MEVYVTQEHIGQGVNAVELALTDAGFKDVALDWNERGEIHASWSIENLPKQDGFTGRNLVWTLPFAVRILIRGMTKGYNVGPFMFEVPDKFSPVKADDRRRGCGDGNVLGERNT